MTFSRLLCNQYKATKLLTSGDVASLKNYVEQDATFEGEALLMVPCLRGQVMTVTGEWVMFWSVDIGLLGYIPKAKVYCLPENIASQAPLISICLLRGPVCEMDEVFLESAYQLLQIILETNTQTGKHMLLCGSGEHILSLFEYPEAIIRVAFLDLLLCLAKNSRDVVEFLVNHQFDVTLLGKLERYVHIYTADLCSCTELMEKEIKQMVMILQAILEQKEDVRNSSDNRRTSRVLQMFLCNKKCLWKQLMERCVSLLGGKSTKTPYNYRESFRYGQQQTYRHDWGRQHERHHGTYLHHSRSEMGDKKAMRYRDRMRVSDQSGFSCGERRLLKHDRDSKQEYRNESHFTHQQSSMQKHLEQSLHEMCKISPTSELGEKQQANPKEDNPKSRLETQTKAEPERTRTETLGKQQKENGDYFHMGKASTKTDSEPAADRLLMSRCGGDGKTKIHHGGQPRETTFRLSKFNTLKPPTSVQNCVAATYHDLIVCSNVPSPEGDTERVTKQIEEVSFDSETDYVIYGTKAAVKPDRTHDLVLDKKLWEMKEVLLAQRLCGLLNNNIEGSMFFGLSIDSIIEGVRLQRKDKDVFRNGIDRIMNRCLIPEVRANSYDIVFTPVLRQDEMVVDLTQHGLYIIEIRVRPMVHIVYMVYQGHKCFMRQEAETVECTAQQKKQEMMDAEDRALKGSIKEMGAIALTDLASLAEFVNTYLPH
ncbi:uncharacterized protein LOC111869878 isoform X2 [Cryptotermes secundus]|uniref:uncharacterized protein LOC111869878 isoform X2 n=1 Tax=Cryptotermes secundus TaxID=105785 RepID=UPI000CD7AB02|nr:uncharacterized protein LOC111869878 isoform X2 [Cryptotermes secundus]